MGRTILVQWDETSPRPYTRHNLIQGTYSICNGCGEPIKKEDLESPKYEKGVSCTSCFDNLSGEKIKSSKERQKQIELSKERGEIHLGE